MRTIGWIGTHVPHLLLLFSKPGCVQGEILLDAGSVGAGQALNQASVEQQQVGNVRSDPPYGAHRPGSSFSYEIRRRDRADQTTSREPLRNFAGTGQGIGTAGGETFHRKTLDVQVV